MFKIKIRKKFTNEDIFRLGIFLLPFENLFFAPSLGWATLSPILFFFYGLLDLRKFIYTFKKYLLFFLIILFFILISLVNAIFYTNVYVSNVIGAVISITLGCSILISFDIYFRQNKGDLKAIIKILLFTYTLSLIMGWIQHFSLKFNLQFIIDIIISLSKRGYYLSLGRVQFTFTEPSFLSVHLYGVLLPFYLYSKDKRIIKLIIIFLISATIFDSSLRLIIDTLAISLIYIIFNINLRKIKSLVLVFITPIILLSSISWAYDNIPRFKLTLDNGIYADGSFASRFFRINATFKGYEKDIMKFLTGYGLGNSIIPLRMGYEEARNEYKNTYYFSEVNTLGNYVYQDDSVTFCLYTRIISEFGFISLVLFLLYLFLIRKKNYHSKENTMFLFILLYIYVQFESYAFYSIWLYIVFCNLDVNYKKRSNWVYDKNIGT